MFARPICYKLVASVTSTKVIWKPIPPSKEFLCIGYVLTNSEHPPALHLATCIHRRYLKEVPIPKRVLKTNSICIARTPVGHFLLAWRASNENLKKTWPVLDLTKLTAYIDQPITHIYDPLRLQPQPPLSTRNVINSRAGLPVTGWDCTQATMRIANVDKIPNPLCKEIVQVRCVCDDNTNNNNNRNDKLLLLNRCLMCVCMCVCVCVHVCACVCACVCVYKYQRMVQAYSQRDIQVIEHVVSTRIRGVTTTMTNCITRSATVQSFLQLQKSAMSTRVTVMKVIPHVTLQGLRAMARYIRVCVMTSENASAVEVLVSTLEDAINAFMAGFNIDIYLTQEIVMGKMMAGFVYYCTVYLLSSTHRLTCEHICVCVYFLCVHMCVCMYFYACVCVYVCVCIYIYRVATVVFPFIDVNCEETHTPHSHSCARIYYCS